MIITNGSLLDEDLALFMKKYNVEVGISLDGPMEINDKMRIQSNGEGTYTKIIKAMLKIYLKNNKTKSANRMSQLFYSNLKIFLRTKKFF